METANNHQTIVIRTNDNPYPQLVFSIIDIPQTVWYVSSWNIAVWLKLLWYVNSPKKEHFEHIKEVLMESYIGTTLALVL